MKGSIENLVSPLRKIFTDNALLITSQFIVRKTPVTFTITFIFFPISREIERQRRNICNGNLSDTDWMTSSKMKWFYASTLRVLDIAITEFKKIDRS